MGPKISKVKVAVLNVCKLIFVPVSIQIMFKVSVIK